MDQAVFIMKEQLKYKWQSYLLIVLLLLVTCFAAQADTLTFYHHDASGTPIAATDEQGKVVWTERHEAFGEPKLKQQSKARHRVDYTGHVYDKDLGLHYQGRRFYDARIGRFMGSDPVGFTPENIQSFNRYAYANNNPYKFYDPDGESPHLLAGGVIGAVSSLFLQGGLIATGLQDSFSFTQLAADTAVGAATAGFSVAAQAGKYGQLAQKLVGGVDDVAKVTKGLPNKADDLLKQGYKETSHPGAAKAGHRTFENSKTGDKVRFDQGKPGKPGYEGQDHYHRYNPNATGKTDQYLDKSGNPCARGCDASHLFPGD